MQKIADERLPDESDREFQLSLEERELGDLLDRLLTDNLTSPLRRHSTDLKEQLESELREQMRVLLNRLMNDLERMIRNGQQDIASELDVWRRQAGDGHNDITQRVEDLRKTVVQQQAEVQSTLSQLISLLDRQGEDRNTFEQSILLKLCRVKLMASRRQRSLIRRVERSAANQRTWFRIIALLHVVTLVAALTHFA